MHRLYLTNCLHFQMMLPSSLRTDHRRLCRKNKFRLPDLHDSWCTFVYDPICHWVWGWGWLRELGALDLRVHCRSHQRCIAALTMPCSLANERARGISELHTIFFQPFLAQRSSVGWFGFTQNALEQITGCKAFFVTTLPGLPPV